MYSFLTEAALLGGAIEQGVDSHLIILSDGAPQFNVRVHALCWVHAERALRRLPSNTAQQRQTIRICSTSYGSTISSSRLTNKRPPLRVRSH
jgi:hypothetical protein